MSVVESSVGFVQIISELEGMWALARDIPDNANEYLAKKQLPKASHHSTITH